MLLFALALAAAAPSVPTTALAGGTARDPFASLADTAALTTPEWLPALQKVEVDSVKLQGVVVGTASPRAMLVLPDGTVHIVRLGDVVGRHLGRVTSIRTGVVVVSEDWRDVLGGHTVEKHELSSH